MPRDKERPAQVLLVATLVCVVCALLVSTAVVVLRPIQDRNALLVQMTDSVAELVLRDNHRQTQAISLLEY